MTSLSLLTEVSEREDGGGEEEAEGSTPQDTLLTSSHQDRGPPQRSGHGEKLNFVS